MLCQFVEELTLGTRGRGFTEITAELAGFVRRSRVGTGLLTVHLRHTSASLLIQENADPDVRADFERFFRRLVPDGDPLFRHTAEGEDDMPAHVRTALTCVNLSVPVVGGAMALGTWQGVYVWEHRRHPHRRGITLHLLGDSDSPPVGRRGRPGEAGVPGAGETR
jgi:secondary thiamine-phosphate synthase enzyme